MILLLLTDHMYDKLSITHRAIGHCDDQESNKETYSEQIITRTLYVSPQNKAKCSIRFMSYNSDTSDMCAQGRLLQYFAR